ncbi:SPOR domain-containing protein [Flavihumibacter fluvii]|uniref:SPOR domain-containing protein n=1 Tax=Flavihumibacter fluvii TaxID=2838157 RepID=UPI001BDE828F|nr:SPOR domain-containing protein [Flavihumibacter fluvii]ULQ52834.1 SPOR domain-containing protein [Flavihumibacter fluvii]
MRHYLLFAAIVFLSPGAFAQVDSTTVAVHKDPRIDLLVKKQVEINEATSRESRRNSPGFRIQVINTTDRNAAIQAKTKVYTLYPELKAYLLYQAPYFRLRVGNFINRKDAEQVQRQLSKEFSQNLFIVNDTVEVNPDKSSE